MRKSVIHGICKVAVVVILAVCLTGFKSSCADNDTYIVENLLKQRTEIIQKAMFSVYNVDDIFAELSTIETYPLLTEDWENTVSMGNSDCDRIVNMQVADVKKIKKIANLYFYDVTVDWYMSGNEGYYCDTEEYEIRLMTSNKRLFLFDMINM